MLNQAQIIGHVGRDPEVRSLQNGDTVASFSIATTEKWKDKSTGEQREATEWHRVSVFGKLAEIVQKWVTKGSLVYVSGKIVTRKYQDKDGLEKQTTEIRADSMKLLGGDKSGKQEPSRQQAKPPQQHSSPGADLDDDVPF
jgi:single-strand DNA-binding protein